VSPSSQDAFPMSDRVDSSKPQAIRDEIAELERRLHDAKYRLIESLSREQPTSIPPAKVLRSNGTRWVLLWLDTSLTLFRAPCCVIPSLPPSSRRLGTPL